MTINLKNLNFDTCPAYQGLHVNKRSQGTYFASILYIEWLKLFVLWRFKELYKTVSKSGTYKT